MECYIVIIMHKNDVKWCFCEEIMVDKICCEHRNFKSVFYEYITVSEN